MHPRPLCELNDRKGQLFFLFYNANKQFNKMAQTNSIQVFNSPQFGQVRTAGTSDNPQFCLADICRVLDLQSSAVMRRLQDDVITSHPITDSLGREQVANFVNEDGLYDVILE